MRINRLSLFCGTVICGFALTANALSDAAVVANAMDKEAAVSAKSTHHALPVAKHKGTARLSNTESSSQASASGTATPSANLRFPADLENGGGSVLDSVVSHAIYLMPNGFCPVSTCWGAPELFLQDLGHSNFIHVVDQYVGLNSNNRYTNGSDAFVKFTTSSTPLTDTDVLTYVHSVAVKSGLTGYGHIYHVFLPQGQDECFDSTFSQCYSPDNPSSWAFCAYHGSADFTDIGHVIYSVEPYQNVLGCSVKPGTPNGQLVDSTNNVLSHELIEAITDPDGTAWTNTLDNGLYGEEIGDECSFLTVVGGLFYFDPTTVTLNVHQYAIQPEYSNAGHACIALP